LDDVVSETPLQGVSLLPAGASARCASDLLWSPRLATLLERATQRYDHVVIDSPPALLLSDARTIAKLVEAVILVVSGETERGALLRTKQTVEGAGARLLGFVMNRFEPRALEYDYYRGYGYYYACGE
jgi:Mrp family chromosome partitioning ATPase